jgi:diaminobutyrate-2-oxoglutarate transaminase
MQDTESVLKQWNYPGAPSIRLKPPGPKASQLLERQRVSHSNVLAYPKQFPLAPDSARGATIMDVDGNCYVDFSSGQGVLNVGHCHPDVVAAVQRQVGKISHALDFPGLPRVELAERLRAIAPGTLRDTCKVFFSSPSGAEAVESAIKLAKYCTGKVGVIAFEGGWHGTSGIALSLTGQKKFREPFLPVYPGVYHVPYSYCYRCRFGLSYPECGLRCAQYLEHVVHDLDSGADSPGCVILEGIQGAGGHIVPPEGYLAEVRRICTRYGLILIVDEIMTGFGRTGRMFSCEHWDVTPDIMVISKSLGGELPLSAIIIREDLDAWADGIHAGTFRGNLTCCAAGLASLRVVEQYQLASRTLRLGEQALSRLKELTASRRLVGDVRGKGFFLGVEFVKDRKSKEPAPEIVKKLALRCFERGLLFLSGGTCGNVARITPALVITEEALLRGIEILAEEIAELER